MAVVGLFTSCESWLDKPLSYTQSKSSNIDMSGSYSIDPIDELERGLRRFDLEELNNSKSDTVLKINLSGSGDNVYIVKVGESGSTHYQNSLMGKDLISTEDLQRMDHQGSNESGDELMGANTHSN
jgi:hypothetical protein